MPLVESVEMAKEARKPLTELGTHFKVFTFANGISET